MAARSARASSSRSGIQAVCASSSTRCLISRVAGRGAAGMLVASASACSSAPSSKESRSTRLLAPEKRCSCASESHGRGCRSSRKRLPRESESAVGMCWRHAPPRSSAVMNPAQPRRSITTRCPESHITRGMTAQHCGDPLNSIDSRVAARGALRELVSRRWAVDAKLGTPLPPSRGRAVSATSRGELSGVKRVPGIARSVESLACARPRTAPGPTRAAGRR